MQQSFPDSEVFTAYGPTEGTIACTLCLIPSGWQEYRCVIGKPLPNTMVRVCDSLLQPCPIGVVGEICIGGAGVALGYWRRPELTSERFVVLGGHPYYRSGDLGRLLSDGTIEFLGRKDGQVKIRGSRVELEEIQSVLSQLPGVREAAVIVTSLQDEQRRLVAYVSGAVIGDELRRALRGKLPDFMVPFRVIVIDELPLNQNGKLDRSALPPFENVDREVKSDEEPRTPVEEILAAIWAEILGVTHVGINDNFFELGGDSILSIQVVARANQLGLGVTPRQLFECQTIAELAAVTGESRNESGFSRSGQDQGQLTPIQQWWFGQPVTRRDWFTQSVILRLRCCGDSSHWRKGLAAVIDHHDALRAHFTNDNGSWRRFTAASESAQVFSEIDLRFIAEGFRKTIWEQTGRQLQRSLNLNQGPVIRSLFARMGKWDELLIVVHHLSIDAASWRILLGDLQRVYGQLQIGRPLSLPSKSTTFHEWADRLKRFCESETVVGELDHWRSADRLRWTLPVSEVPEENGHATYALDAEVTRQFLHDAHQPYRTRPDELLLSALGSAWCRCFSTSDVVVNIERHGREDIDVHADLTRTIGWFTTLYPVVLTNGNTDSEIIVQNKNRLRSVPHGGIRYLAIQRRIPGNESTDVIKTAAATFNYLANLDALDGERGFWELIGSLAPEPEGLTQRPPLSITAFVKSERLQIELEWDGLYLTRSRAESLGAEYLRILRSLIAHCCAQGTVTLNPTDFPNLGVSQDALDRLLGDIEASGLEE
jgi:non-ribosomal peptide synthase protein (TIGR01720 family)